MANYELYVAAVTAMMLFELCLLACLLALCRFMMMLMVMMVGALCLVLLLFFFCWPKTKKKNNII